MKKILALVLSLILLCSAAAFAEETVVGMANPWTEVEDMAAFCEKVGVELAIPEGAEDVVLRVLEDNGDGIALGEMDFTLDGMEYTARVSFSNVTDGIEDISGMYYEWETEEETTVAGLKAVIMQASDEENTAEVVNWLDIVPGIVYSLSTVQKDVDGLDLTAIAEEIYIPMQGEA